MKYPKQVKRYCPTCKKHSLQKVSEVKGRVRGSLKHGSIQRARKRGRGRGYGNLGKWGSKPALSKFKMTGAKSSKKTNLRFTCTICNKTNIQSKGFRTKKLVFEQ